MLAYLAPFTATLFVAAGCFVRLVGAVPLEVSLAKRDVASPPVTAPNASTVWTVGETQTVVWDTSNLPTQITNPQGTVLLGFVNDTSGNEHLMIDNPLASGFDITSGSVQVVVPDVEPRADYIIALLGDSGNISDKFTIKNSTTSSPSPTPSTTISPVISPSDDPTGSQPSTNHPSTIATPTPPSTQLGPSSISRPASSGTLQSFSSQLSTSASASATQTDTSDSSSSAADPQTVLSGLMVLVIPIVTVFILA